MRVIFLDEGYDPFPSPNSICVNNLVNEIKDRGIDYFVVCDGPLGYENRFSNDEHIVHVPCKKDTIIAKKSVIGKFKTLIDRLFILPIWPIRFPKKVQKYIRVIENKIGIEYDDILISTYKPAEMVEIGYKLKKRHPEISFEIYSLDGIGSNLMIVNSKMIRWMEGRWLFTRFDRADKILQMKCHEEAYSNSKYGGFLYKTSFLDFPLIVKSPHVKGISIDDKIRFLYSGSFYKRMREPYTLIEWFKRLSNDRNCTLDLYSQGEFDSYLDEIAEQSHGKICRHDFVRPEEMERIIANSDVLLNVGNGSSPMVPSKLFVYMSSGKPIVHFISDDADSCMTYLERYENACILDERKSIDENLKSFIEAFPRDEYKVINFNEVNALFISNTPQYTVDSILGNIGKDDKR